MKDEVYRLLSSFFFPSTGLIFDHGFFSSLHTRPALSPRLVELGPPRRSGGAMDVARVRRSRTGREKAPGLERRGGGGASG